MKNRDELLKARQERISHIFDSFNDDLEKGKKAQIGEEREWNGKKYKKVGEGQWVPVSEGGRSEKKEDTPKDAKAKKESTESSSSKEEEAQEPEVDEASNTQQSKISTDRDTDSAIGQKYNGVVKEALDKYEAGVQLGHMPEGNDSKAFYVNQEVDGYGKTIDLSLRSGADVEKHSEELKQHVLQMIGMKRDYYSSRRATTADSMIYNHINQEGLSKEEKKEVKRVAANLVRKTFRELQKEGKMTKVKVGFRGAEKTYWAVTKPGTEADHLNRPQAPKEDAPKNSGAQYAWASFGKSHEDEIQDHINSRINNITKGFE